MLNLQIVLAILIRLMKIVIYYSSILSSDIQNIFIKYFLSAIEF